jgi:hypothetical protein
MKFQNELPAGSPGDQLIEIYYRRERRRDLLVAILIGSCCAAAVVFGIIYGDRIDLFFESLLSKAVR